MVHRPIGLFNARKNALPTVADNARIISNLSI